MGAESLGAVVFAAIIGFALGVFWSRGRWAVEAARAAHLEAQVEAEGARARGELARQKETYERLIDDMKLTEERLRSSFTAVATSVLDKNTERFKESAEKDLRQIKTEGAADLDSRVKVFETAVEELKTRLREANEKISNFEKERIDTYARLEQRMRQMHEQEQRLLSETDRLKSALTTSHSVRGRWGELVLRNILASSELMSHIDYEEQVGVGDDRKPDFIVNLPHAGQKLVIDAKTSLYESYMEGETAKTEAERREMHLEFARKCRKRVMDLASKEYQKNVSDSVPYVVMFVPGEAAIRAAFDADPGLFQFAMDKGVFITSPVTIIPLLMLVANGWQQFKMSTQARELSVAVEEVGRRLDTFVSRLGKVQKGLDAATRAWNEAIDKSWNGQQSVVRSLERARELGGQIPGLSELEALSVAPSETGLAHPEKLLREATGAVVETVVGGLEGEVDSIDAQVAAAALAVAASDKPRRSRKSRASAEDGTSRE